MSKATRPLGPFTLSGPSRTVQFDTIKDVARYLAKHRIPASSLMGEEDISANPLLYDAPLYRLTDECGLIVPIWQIQGAVKQASEEEMRSWRRKFPRYKYDPEKDFRNGPLPIGRKRRYGRFYRRVKTKSELRDLHGLKADMQDVEEIGKKLKIRAKRLNVPTAWDDLVRQDGGGNWKKYRKTQYKS